ncbi:hypothetical protein SPRG_02464 [Saprolegnia parasitica CBS 223.65]|uniref:Uncharacterized protein n=1 Tax=Saprolegnia parasitica (strain CBS 223.65) TaxID=695850 RepID=A0A067D208_SAPPC|nr:hypothetical protein SPRG_02464 [Saprolegnia parasitica CBS 223.65]KDO32766.1 hypothetical protein SPRG_02464 [Saprolegnia parasitica CBS 223.65]|eukprot:XP_012196430.1 hypothetical protein SPRG_02464 [Saprolegnia parasitica CBS 223.65]
MAQFMGLHYILNTSNNKAAHYDALARDDILRTSNLLVNLNGHLRRHETHLPPLSQCLTADRLAIDAATVRRRLAIERRNAKRQIVSRASAVPTSSPPVLIHVKNTKNRVSAAAYREKREHKLSFIIDEIHRLEAAHPSLRHRPFAPAKKAKSVQLATESKDEYRRRTNRESAAESRLLQQEKVWYLSRELARLRALAPQ